MSHVCSAGQQSHTDVAEDDRKDHAACGRDQKRVGVDHKDKVIVEANVGSNDSSMACGWKLEEVEQSNHLQNGEDTSAKVQHLHQPASADNINS